MLPSGNDAALALAEHFGGLSGSTTPYTNFIGKMNKLAGQLKLTDTVFRNPHGMSTSLNISTAKNLACLALYALKIPIFKKIVNTYQYTCKVYNNGEIRKVT